MECYRAKLYLKTDIYKDLEYKVIVVCGGYLADSKQINKRGV